MQIVIFSDLHGKLLLAFNLVKKLQEERGIKVDYILQCGDAGIFPDLSKLDRATLKHSNSDISELGFNKYFFKYDTEIKKLFDSVNCPMICVRGNHEDHDFLDDLEKNYSESYFPVDFYKRIFVIKTGEVFSLSNDKESINILGIGRIGSPDKKKSQRYLQEYERNKVNQLSLNEHIDLLITHDSALDFVTHGFGMPEIRDVLKKHEPLYHFFGHTGSPCIIKPDENGFTTSVKVAEIRVMEHNKLPEGSMLLLTWINYEQNRIEVLDKMQMSF